MSIGMREKRVGWCVREVYLFSSVECGFRMLVAHQIATDWDSLPFFTQTCRPTPLHVLVERAVSESRLILSAALVEDFITRCVLFFLSG